MTHRSGKGRIKGKTKEAAGKSAGDRRKEAEGGIGRAGAGRRG
ncbi:hypothetical protein ACFV1C_01000 [Streptomyces sp. NPDC059605]